MNIKNVLVTGSHGLVGKNLCNKLNSMDITLDSVDLVEIRTFDNNLEGLKEFILNKVKSKDIVFHVGANAYTSDFSADIIFTNYYITKIIIDCCYSEKVNMIFSSTQMVNGRKEIGYPENLYGWSKLMSEEYGILKSQYAWRTYNSTWYAEPFKFIALRYSNIYGPDESHKGVAASLAYKGWTEGKIDLWAAKRDFVYIDDVVDSNIYAIDQPIGVYDVGSGESRSAIDLVRNMGAHIEITEKPDYDVPPWFQWFTESKTENFMNGWVPKYNLEEGTEKYKKYLESRN